MNYARIRCLSDLQNILEAKIFIISKSSLMYEELAENAWGIMFDENLIPRMHLEDFQDFMTRLLRRRSEQIAQLAIPITLYLWFDEQALQLWFNFLSGRDATLPFGCRLNKVNSSDVIFEKYLNTMRQIVTEGNKIEYFDIAEDFDDNDGEEEYVLDVYVTTL